MNNSLKFSAGAFALGLPLLVGAQGVLPAATDAKAPRLSLRYQSAFADYKPYQDVPPGDWKALNDTVRDGSAGQMGMGGRDMTDGMSMPARDATKVTTPSSPMHMSGAHAMPNKTPAGMARPSAPTHMDAAHPMSGGKP